MSVDDVRDRVVAHVPEPRHDVLDARDALVLRLVREHRTRDDVADGVHPGHAGAKVSVDGHATFCVERKPDGVEAEAVRIRNAAHRDQHAVAAHRIAAVDVHRTDVAARAGAGNPHSEPERKPLALEDLLGKGCSLRVHPRKDSIEVLEDGDLCSQAAPHRAHFEPDDPRTDDDEMARNGRVREGLGAGADPITVELYSAELCDLAAGRDDYVIGSQLGRDAVPALDRQMPGSEKAGPAGVARDLVLLEEERHAGGVLLHHRVLALQHLGEVELHAGHVDSEHTQAVLRLLVALARLEERLARDAADSDAGAAELRLELDARGIQPELRGADGRDVATGARPDHHQIVLRHVTPRAECVPAPRWFP